MFSFGVVFSFIGGQFWRCFLETFSAWSGLASTVKAELDDTDGFDTMVAAVTACGLAGEVCAALTEAAQVEPFPPMDNSVNKAAAAG